MNTMGMADAVTKQYMKENTVFADAFNFLLYNGCLLYTSDAADE